VGLAEGDGLGLGEPVLLLLAEAERLGLIEGVHDLLVDRVTFSKGCQINVHRGSPIPRFE
jgi:hypothetical protein